MDLFFILLGIVIIGLGLALVIRSRFFLVPVIVNNGLYRFRFKRGESLLDALFSKGIYLPSSCGGRALCGMCKVKVNTKPVDYSEKELRLISSSEKEEGIHLSCQLTITGPLRIYLSPSILTIKRYKARVSSIKDLTSDIKEIKFRVLGKKKLLFRAGQFCQLIIPPYDRHQIETRRAYSLANSPAKDQELEFVVKRVAQGVATTYLHDMLKVGQTLELLGPMGDFQLHEDENATMICIGGGSGVPPLKSLVLDMYEQGKHKQAIWFFFGAVSKKDLFYLDFFYEMERKWSVFHFIPALSAPLPEDNWQGEKGLITEVAERYLLNQIGKDKIIEIYLCGSMGMINSALNLVKRQGLDPDRVFYDKFF